MYSVLEAEGEQRKEDQAKWEQVGVGLGKSRFYPGMPKEGLGARQKEY
jgi:hypothetical protein